MILLVAAFDLVPLLLVLVLAVVFALPAALGLHALGWVFRSPLLAASAFSASAFGVGFVVEIVVRRKQAARSPRYVAPLDALGVLAHSEVEKVGGKAQSLARAVRLGAPVPDALVLTSELVECILAATAGGRGVDTVFAALPLPARRELEAFLGRSKGRVVARASFTAEGGKHAYPGVFPAVRDIDPRSREALVAAILSLVASADDAVSREYRRRRSVGGGVARAVLVQRQIDADTQGAVASRGPGGRADTVTVDFAKRRSPVRSYAYDLTLGAARPLGVDEPFETPAWMHRLAILAVTLEAEFGGPVQVEFAIEEGQPYVLDVRRGDTAPRKTWIHGRPLDAKGERHPTFAEDLRGGLPLVQKVLSGLLARAGVKAAPSGEARVREDEVRYVDGLVYLDAEILRRALAALGADVLLRGGLRATLRSIERIRRRPVPAVPTVTEITGAAWQELRAWHGRYLLGAAEVRLELVAREWLIRTLLRLVDGSDGGAAAASADRRGHPALRWVLARRLREAAEESERQRTVLEQAEAELASAVARLLARGAAGWNAMFKGDRHLHATLEEIDRWHADVPAREVLETEWKGRRTAFDERKDHAPALRVHRPALPDEAAQKAPASLRAAPGSSFSPASPARPAQRSIPPQITGLGVAPGTARGPAVLLVSGQERGLGVGAILVISDPRSDLCPHVFDARGIILLSGGLVSSVATLAAELGVPTILCPQARQVATHDVVIDGTTGTITVQR